MSTPLLGSSPPVIPIPRQPSPLAFSVSSHSHAHSPPPSPDGRSNRPSIGGSSVSSVALALPPGVEILNSDQLPPTRTKPYIPKSGEDLVPVQPLQDSLLFRSTIAQLDSSCGTLRKFSKAVHHASTALELALEAVEKAEDDLLYAIGEMSRWLELGYGIPTLDVWGDMGVRKARRKKWRVERDEVHAMVSQGCANVKSEMKRHGLAGGGAQAKFEKVTKQYYDQTGAYLSTSDSSSSKHSAPTRSSTVDSEQATRTAQFDLARYTHHSTLLYAVPPSSISCLDMLVNLYGWTGGILSEQGGYGYTDSQISSISHSDSDRRSSLSVLDMRESLSVSLARLAGIRGELLDRWDMRNDQTNRLDVLTGRASVDVPSSARDRDQAQSPSSLIQTTPISSSGIEHRDSREHRKHRIHKIQKSVGGRLRDLLGSGSSSKDLASLERGHGSAYGLSSGLGGERSNRNSFDVSVLARPGAIGRAGGGQAIQEEVDGGGAEGTKSSPLPSIEPQSMPTRPVFPSRRSMNLSPTEAPFIVDSSLFPLAPAMSQEPRSSISSQASSTEPVGKVEKDVGAGLGSGLPGRGAVQARQAMEELDDVGRKKEGVLWGGGTWEDVGKQGKTKWEKYWVVLDHSSIYEYRDADFERPETAHAMIDLKFASIREGRGTDRRFVFEIVTPTQGRRLYQATSEVEMKQWIHAITNAIESSINGTSSIRTFDTSKIRTLSGSYDDHALPIRQRLGFPVPGIRPSGSTSGSAGLSLPTIPASPSGRRSMPPPIRIEDGPGITTSEPKRKRQTSFKKAFRQSAEIASQWKDGLVPRSPSFISDPSRPPFLGIAKRQNSASSGVSSGGVSYASHVAAVGREEDPEVLKRITEDTLVTSTMGPVAGDRSFGSWVEVDDAHSSVGGGHDGEIEKRVMEMAGLGLGNSPGRIPSDRRVKSDGRGKEDGTHLSPPFREMTRSRSADVPVRSDMVGEAERGGEVLDMDTLRRAAAKEGNAVCADCRRSTRSSRWASICLREQPMVIFLCIKCCGIHRSFGTHISKPRSVDLDIWTPETIALALQWGNERANEMWEYAGANAYRPLADEDMTAFCKAKYVEGRFLSDVDRRRFGLI